jgi:hypothetical protein
MKVDEQLQARILTFVIREFIDNKRSTPRRDLILAFEAEDVSTALAALKPYRAAGGCIKSKSSEEGKDKSPKPSFGDCDNGLARLPSWMEIKVDNQVAAPTETRTPNLHRANRSLNEECGWKGGDRGDSGEKKPCPTKKQKNPLDSDRPSHGRP